MSGGLLEKENVSLGGHTDGNVKIVLEFWTQNYQYQEDKCRIRLVYFVLFFSILFHNVFVPDLFFVFIHFMFSMYTVYCYCLLELFCFVFFITFSLTFLSLTFHGSRAFDPFKSKIVKKKFKGNMWKI